MYTKLIGIHLCNLTFVKHLQKWQSLYILRASSRDCIFTNFLSCHDKFRVAEESRSTSIYACFFAGFARTHALSAYIKHNIYVTIEQSKEV